jgi:hypothetical protein
MPARHTWQEEAQRKGPKDAEQRDKLACPAADERKADADGPAAGCNGEELATPAADALETAALDAPWLDEPGDDVARRDEDHRHARDGHGGRAEPGDADPTVRVGESVEQHRRRRRGRRKEEVRDERERQGEGEDDARLEHRGECTRPL